MLIWIFIKEIINLFLDIRHFINKDFKLKSYLLAMKDLSDKHSGVYINKVLLNTLKEFNIKYNINR
jgi:hypothetical protein